MRIPALTIVLIVSCAGFSWHGFDKYQSLKQFHKQTLSLTASRSLRAIESELEALRWRANAFTPANAAIARSLELHFPKAEKIFVGDPADAVTGLFGSTAALDRCSRSSANVRPTRSAFCFSEENALILKIGHRDGAEPRVDIYVRFGVNWLDNFLESLPPGQFRTLLNGDTAGDTGLTTPEGDRGGFPATDASGFSKRLGIPNTSWQLVARINPAFLIDQRNQIAREVLLALAVFLLLAATGMRFIRKTENRGNRLERDLSSERERARVTLESIADAVVTIDKRGVIDYMNPVAESLTGIEKSDASGRNFNDVFNISIESTDSPIEINTLFANRSLPILRDDCILKTATKEYSIRLSAAPLKDREGVQIGTVVALSDTTQSRLIARRMAYQATHDALTGLENRRQFESRLDQALLGAREHGNQHVLCYIDLDQFKLINDDAGHIAGDALLKQIASLLSSKMRARDLLARIGGDEFALLLENCPLEKATSIALNIVNTVAGYRFEWYGKIYQTSASIGIAPINSYAENREQILSQADVACYAAKDLGRNQINVYQTGSGVPARKHTEIRLATDIRDALEENRFHLHAQPIVNLKAGVTDRDISRFEVLLRMYGKNNEIITPNAFIPAAERYNLMTQIDRWVIEKTLKICDEFAPKDARFEVGVNLSGSSLSDETLLDFVQTQLLKYDTDNIRICFEVTETAAISNFPNAHEFITYMREIGCRFALDDFGTGLSSFSYLKSLPVDYLKIDGSFIRNIDNDPIDNAMVGSILQISRILKIPVIAEFAEREKIVKHLREMGVDYGQGSALGPPSPIETYLARWDERQTAAHPGDTTIDDSPEPLAFKADA